MTETNIVNHLIDVHTHILPGVDDGSRNMRESVKMLLSAAEQGVTSVIATPHYSRRRELKHADELAAELEARIQKFYPDFRIYIGQETYYHEELADRLHEGKALTMAGSRYVLVEFSPTVSYKALFQGIRKLSENGYIPILAHMERYVCLRHEGVKELLSCGCRLQMNFDSLKGLWCNPETVWCRKQVENGTIHLLGSDMHRMDFRPPDIREVMKWLNHHIDSDDLERILYENPQRILRGEKIV